jgi:hypothetical protein
MRTGNNEMGRHSHQSDDTALYGRHTKGREYAVPVVELLADAIHEGRAIRLVWPYDDPDSRLETTGEPSTTEPPAVRHDSMADAEQENERTEPSTLMRRAWKALDCAGPRSDTCCHPAG